MDFLVGKCIEATKHIDLVGKFVDGEVYHYGVIDVPQIKVGDTFRVKSVDRGVVVLQNLNSDDWQECELLEEEIDDFKLKPSNWSMQFSANVERL